MASADQKATHFDYIDALRGIACLGVVVLHSYYNFSPTGFALKAFVGLARQGWLGVNLFLVLSGFCLSFPIFSRGQSAREVNWMQFFSRRSWRILPTYYFVLFTCLTLIMGTNYSKNEPIFSGHAEIKQIFTHIFMIHNLFLDTVTGVNGSFWSLALEFQWYFFFPIAVFIFKKFGAKAALLCSFLISFGWQSGVASIFGFSPEWPIVAVYCLALPARIFEFFCGMAAAQLILNKTARHRDLSLRVFLGFTVFGIFYLRVFSRFHPLSDQIWGIAFASLVVWLSFVPYESLNRSKSFRALKMAGIFSYSLYLVNEFSIHYLKEYILPRVGRSEVGDFLLILVIDAFVLLLAYGVYQLVERRFELWRARKNKLKANR